MDVAPLLDRVTALASDLERVEQERARIRAELREAIIEAHNEKVPLAAIGRAAGLSRQRIRQLVS